MPGHENPNSIQGSSKESYQETPSNTKFTANIDTKVKTSDRLQGQQQHQPASGYWTSQNNTIDDQSQQSTMSSTTSNRSMASSTRGSSSIDSAKRPLVSEPRRSSIERAMDKAKNKLGGSRSGAKTLPSDELEYERQRAKAEEKQRRQEEYERLGLKDRTLYGMPGRVNFSH